MSIHVWIIIQVVSFEFTVNQRLPQHCNFAFCPNQHLKIYLYILFNLEHIIFILNFMNTRASWRAGKTFSLKYFLLVCLFKVYRLGIHDHWALMFSYIEERSRSICDVILTQKLSFSSVQYWTESPWKINWILPEIRISISIKKKLWEFMQQCFSSVIWGFSSCPMLCCFQACNVRRIHNNLLIARS